MGWRKLKKNRLAVLGLVVVATFILVSILAPVLAPADPTFAELSKRRMPPSTMHPLGLDEMGRDVLSRLIWGSRVALLVATTAVGIGLIGGGLFGLLAGYYGGYWDRLLTGTMEILLAFPSLLLAIFIVGALGPDIRNAMIAIGIWTIPTYGRIIRGSVLAIKQREFIEAAKALGVTEWRIILLHVLPNCLSPLIVHTTLNIGRAILAEASLSFLGLGVQPPDPSWGGMIAGGRAYLRVAPHISTFPGLAIFLVVLGFNLLGDGLRDALDPRGRQ